MFDTFPSYRHGLHDRCDLQARGRGHCRRPNCGPAEESGGHTTGRHQHQWAVYVVRVPQPPVWHHQQPVRLGEDTRRKFRLAAVGLTSHGWVEGSATLVGRELDTVVDLSFRVEQHLFRSAYCWSLFVSRNSALFLPDNHITLQTQRLWPWFLVWVGALQGIGEICLVLLHI